MLLALERTGVDMLSELELRGMEPETFELLAPMISVLLLVLRGT